MCHVTQDCGQPHYLGYMLQIMMEGNHTSLSELKEVLKATLESRGSLGQIKARIRAEIFSALDDQSIPKPELSNENLILNELIREYLEYNGYRHALSVFLPESGQPLEKPFPRSFISSELGVRDDAQFAQVPLLYNILLILQQRHEKSLKGAHETLKDNVLDAQGT